MQVPGFDDPNGFYVTPDGLYIPQQYMYFTPDQQYPAAGGPPVSPPGPVDTVALKDLIKKQV